MTKRFYDKNDFDILFARNLTASIDAGDKSHTIRRGWRNYKPGKMRAGCHIDNWERIIEVTSVQWTYVYDISPYDYGYDSHEHMMESLGKYYPNFDNNSKITILLFNKVSEDGFTR